MEFLDETLLSPVWLFSLLFVSLAVNITAQFVFKWCEAIPGRLFRRFRAASSRRQAARNERIQQLRTDADSLLFAYFREVRFRHLEIVFLLLSMFLFLPLLLQLFGGSIRREYVAYTLLSSLASLVALNTGLLCHVTALRIGREIIESMRADDS